MAEKFKILVIIVFGGLIILFQGWHSHELRKDAAYQQRLLAQVRSLGEQNIISVDISAGRARRRQENHKKILTVDEIQVVQELLKTADIGRIGGHNLSVYDCVLTLELEENVSLSFWGTVFGEYEWNKDDVFLLEYQEPGRFDDFYRQSRIIRVKNLGKWLVENGPKNQQYN